MPSIRSLIERPISNYLAFTHHVTPHIVATKSLEYLLVIKLEGRSPVGANIADMYEWVEARNNTLKGINAGEIGFWTHTVRKKVVAESEGKFSQTFASQFDATYSKTFEKNSLMVNELYLTVLIRQAKDPLLNSLAKFEKMDKAQHQAWQADAISRLQEVGRVLCQSMTRYVPRMLGIREHNGIEFSEPMEFVGELLNGKASQMPITRDYFYNTLPIARPVFSRWGELAELRDVEGSRYFGILEMRDLPEKLRPGHLDDLLKSPFPFVLTQSWSSFTRAHAQSALKRHRKLMVDSNDDAQSQISALTTALDDLAAGKWGLGEHHATLQVFGEQPDIVRKHLSQCMGELAGLGVIVRPTDKALEAAYWAQLPGNWDWRPRPKPLTSFNFLDLVSFHNVPAGKAEGNPWGPAVTMLKTEAGSPFWFNFHATLDDEDATGDRRLGNTMLIGKSGTGKTVLLSHLLTQAQRFDPTVVVMDKDQGMHVTILALGGRYFTLRLGQQTGWAPFQLEPTEANLLFMRRFAAQLASARGEGLSTREHSDLGTAIEQMTSLIPRQDRGITTLVNFLPHPLGAETLTLHERLMPWCEGGEYGWLFDGQADTMDLTTHRLYGFDMTELLLDPIVRTTASMYLQHRWDALTDGSRRVIQITDEVQHVLKDSFYQERLQDQARTIRKKDMLMANATQEPAAITDNPIGRTLVQQSATLIFLPNPEATRDDYILGFKLTEAEFQLVKNLGEFSRMFLIKQGGRCTIAQLDLAGCDEALAVFSGNAKRGNLAQELTEIHGSAVEQWLPHYLAAVRNK